MAAGDRAVDARVETVAVHPIATRGSRIYFFTIRLALCFGLSSPCAGWAGQQPQLKLLVSDQALHDLPDAFNDVAADDINQAGDYVFVAGSNEALFLRRAGAPAPIRLLQAGDPVPGFALSRVVSISTPRLNDSGRICFVAAFLMGRAAHNALFTFDGSSFRKVAYSEDAAPGSAGQTFGAPFTVIGMNQAGDVAFASTLVPAGSSLPYQTSIFIAPAGGGSTIRVAGYGDAAPAGPGGTLSYIQGLRFNNRGDVLFYAYAGTDTSGKNGLFVASASGVRKIMISGDNDPQGQPFGQPDKSALLNNSGQVAFFNSQYYARICVSNPGGELILAASSATPSPAGLGGYLTPAAPTGFNDAGEIAFTGKAGSNTYGIFRYRPGQPVEAVAYENQPIPGTGSTLRDSVFNNPSMNSSGQISFAHVLSNQKFAIFRQTGSAAPEAVVLDSHSAAGWDLTPLTGDTTRILDDGSVMFSASVQDHIGAWTFLTRPAGIQSLVSPDDSLPAGARTILQPEMKAAGNYLCFYAHKAGGRQSLWVHDTVRGITSRVAADGDPIPGGIVQIKPLSASVNAAGTVAFDNFGKGLYLWNASSGLQRLIGPGDSIPGVDGNLIFVSIVPNSRENQINDAGQVVFSGTPSSGYPGIFVASPGAPPAKIVLCYDPALGQAGMDFWSVDTGSGIINQSGDVAFKAEIYDTNARLFGRKSYRKGVFIGSAGSAPAKIFMDEDSAPGGGKFTYLSYGGIDFADDERVVFMSNVTAGSGVFTGKRSELPQLVVPSTEVSALGQASSASILSNVTANRQADCVFSAGLSGASTNSGWFLHRASTDSLQALAFQGQPAPDNSGTYSLISSSSISSLGPAGEVVFLNDVNLNGMYATGVFRYRTDGTFERVMLMGDPAPGGAGGTVGSVTVATGESGSFIFRVAIVAGATTDAIYSLESTTPTITATTTSVSPATASYSGTARAVTLAASISATPGPATGGTVTFTVKSGSTGIGSPVTAPVVNGASRAAYSLPGGVAAGNYTIEAAYSGNADFAASSGTEVLVITPAAVACSNVYATTAYSDATQLVPLSVTVSAGTTVANQGTVRFTVKDGANAVGTPLVCPVFNGFAAGDYLLPAGTAVKTYTIDIAYSGGSNFAAATGTGTLVVIAAQAAVAIHVRTVATLYSSAGQEIALTAEIEGPPATGGSVTFRIRDGVNSVGVAAIGAVAGGVSSVLYSLPAGTPAKNYWIEAHYSRPNYQESTGRGMLAVLSPEQPALSRELQGSGGSASASSGSGDLTVGYGEVVYTSGTAPGVLANFGLRSGAGAILATEAGVSAAGLVSSTGLFVDYTSRTNSGVAIVNPSLDEAAQITAIFRDGSGSEVARSSIQLNPGQHLARFADQIAPRLPIPFLGTMTLTSTIPIAATSLSTVVNARGDMLYSAVPVEDFGAPPAGTTLLFPHFVAGGGIPSSILLTNPDNAPQSGTITFWDSDGNPLSLNFEGMQQPQSRIDYTLAPHGMMKLTTRGDGSQAAGYVKVVKTSGTGRLPVGSVSFQIQDGTMVMSQVGVLAGTESTSLRGFVQVLPAERKDTGLALVNRNGTAANIRLRLLKTDGTAYESNITLGPNGYAAKMMSQLFAGLPGDFQGALAISSDVPVTALTLRLTINGRGEQIYSTLPLVDLNHPPAGRLFIPQFANGGGYQTQIILINTSDAAGTVRILLYNENGAPMPWR